MMLPNVFYFDSSANFKTEDSLEITKGVLDIISTIGSLVGGPYGAIITSACGLIGTILIHYKPNQPNVVDQLAHVVHKELVDFNTKFRTRSI